MDIIYEDVKSDCELSGFNCGNTLINDQIHQYAYYYNLMKIGRSAKIIVNDNIVGCFMLRLVTIKADEDDEANSDYYAISIDVLAIDRSQTGKHIGTATINYIVSQAKKVSDFCGCRYLILTPVPDRIEWYKDRGFNYYLDENEKPKMIIDWRDNELVDEYISQ